MINEKKQLKQFVSLAGGLGNQLFQFAAALSTNDEQKIFFIEDIFNPSRNESGILELFEFKFFNLKQIDFIPIRISPKKSLKFFANQIIKSGVNGSSILGKTYHRSLNSLFQCQIKKVFSKNKIALVTDTFNLEKDNHKIKEDILQIGYFQNSEYALQVRNIMKDYKISGFDIVGYLSARNYGKYLAVHIRRGDYEKERNFGLIPRDYYMKAIAIQLEQYPYDNIVIFSDDIEKAKKIIHSSDFPNINYFEDKNLSSAQVLAVMSNANGFVIANSSFSWWAAMLSASGFNRVFAPNPWFLKTKIHEQLLPVHWTKLSW